VRINGSTSFPHMWEFCGPVRGTTNLHTLKSYLL